MRSFVFATLAAIASANQPDWDDFFDSLPKVDVDQFEELWFTNQIDHFNFLDDRTYQQRYWISNQYWDGQGPIFIYICGEYRCSVPDTRLYPFMLGATYNAQFLVLEHRFYGDSQPFDDWSVDNLAYLSSEQGLADLAYFLENINTSDVETLVIGGSYPGAMSAWFRSRYPHVAVGSWASSAVVQPIIDYWQYDEQLYSSTLKYGDWCPEMIQEATAYLNEQAWLRDQGNEDNFIT